MIKIAHNVSVTDLTLTDIQRKKGEVRSELLKEQVNIAQLASEIASPFSRPIEGSGFFKTVKTGWMIFEGVTTGIKLMRKAKSYFKKK
jgi:hypothetical protein